MSKQSITGVALYTIWQQRPITKDVIDMEIPEHIRTQLTRRGGNQSSERIVMNARINLDNHMALKQICVENRFLIGNVLDYLIEGFIADYRGMWPRDGVYQTQLNTEWSKTSPESREKSPKQERTSRVSPDYLVKARELFMYPAQMKAMRGEDVSEELAIINACLDEAIAEGNTHAESNITNWMTILERKKELSED